MSVELQKLLNSGYTYDGLRQMLTEMEEAEKKKEQELIQEQQLKVARANLIDAIIFYAVALSGEEAEFTEEDKEGLAKLFESFEKEMLQSLKMVETFKQMNIPVMPVSDTALLHTFLDKLGK